MATGKNIRRECGINLSESTNTRYQFPLRTERHLIQVYTYLVYTYGIL